jgi:hypothetical protein
MAQVSIRGKGVAAACCAHLLRCSGNTVSSDASGASRVPAIVLGEITQALARDVFDRPELFRDAHRIERRIVAWGPGADLVTVPHSAVVVSEQQLSDLLHMEPLPSNEPDWTIYAARPLPPHVTEHAFGTRKATTMRAQLKEGVDSAACQIESMPEGWLFLIPTSTSEGWLIAVGSPEPDASRLMESIATLAAPSAEFPAYPRIAMPLAEAGILCCGSAALTFDPLCGDGTGHAIREAILATAVIRACSAPGALEHYTARLIAGFRKHLEACHGFYRSGGTSDWWKNELDAIREGIQWCDRLLTQHGPFRYRLQDLELVTLKV